MFRASMDRFLVVILMCCVGALICVVIFLRFQIGAKRLLVVALEFLAVVMDLTVGILR